MILKNYVLAQVFCVRCNAFKNHFLDFYSIDFKKNLIYMESSCEFCEEFIEEEEAIILFFDIKEFNSLIMIPQDEFSLN